MTSRNCCPVRDGRTMGLLLVLTLCAASARADGTFFKNRHPDAAQTSAPSPSSIRTPVTQPPANNTSVENHATPPTTPDPPQAPSPADNGTAPQSSNGSAGGAASGSAPGSAQVERPAGGGRPPMQNVTGNVDDVVSTDTLIIQGERVQLAGVRGDTREAQALKRWLSKIGGPVTCLPVGERYRCSTANHMDIGQVLIRHGAAQVGPGASTEYQMAEIAARREHQGIWTAR